MQWLFFTVFQPIFLLAHSTQNELKNRGSIEVWEMGRINRTMSIPEAVTLYWNYTNETDNGAKKHWRFRLPGCNPALSGKQLQIFCITQCPYLLGQAVLTFVDCLTLKMKVLWSWETSRASHPTTKQDISEHLNLHCSNNLISCKVKLSQLYESSILLHTKINTADVKVLNNNTPK